MAQVNELPCDGDGICMTCKRKPSAEGGETITCRTCATPWHVTCLSASRLETLVSEAEWDCPDCSATEVTQRAETAGPSDLVAAIRAIESDDSLTELEKAKRRQELVSGGAAISAADPGKKRFDDDASAVLDGTLSCSFCMQLPERPVTTPCGHNFCLKCFERWIAQGKRTCTNCRRPIPSSMASQPRINSALVLAIRMAKKSRPSGGGAPKVYHFVHNQNRPEKAYTTERAKKSGKANACSGKIFVTVPPDHFGPILAANDPEKNRGVLVGDSWEDRLDCRQWGVHIPHVAGIAGQSNYGAQSVALSGGYIDDEDHGEWFLYTGSGGRDLSGNKRTSKTQSFDQKFEKYNQALRVSCQNGYPVRVVRSHKEKRSSYAPVKGVRYDGIYRIEKCWRKVGIQGYKVCRYLFVRCDNDPAPWSSDEKGDCPRPLPVIKELKKAVDITERKQSPSWDYDEEKACWVWKKPPPESRKSREHGNSEDGKTVRKSRQGQSMRKKLLKELSCLICKNVMTSPLTTPCAHNFCKPCLEGAFAGQSFTRERTCEGRRALRVQKNIMKCPSCSTDIAEYLQNPQVNRELMDVIESLQRESVETDEDSIEEADENAIEEIDENEIEETDENASESGEEPASTHQEQETDVDDNHIDEQSPAKAEENTEEPQTASEPQQTDKQKKANESISTPENHEGFSGESESSLVKPPRTDDKVPEREPVETKGMKTRNRNKSGGTMTDDKVPESEPVETKDKQTPKRKKAEGKGNSSTPASGVTPRRSKRLAMAKQFA